MDPLSRARKVAGAERADTSEFRTADAVSSLIRPMVGRVIRFGRSAVDKREMGVRLGPNASGELAQRIYKQGAAPPGIRKAGFAVRVRRAAQSAWRPMPN